MEVAPQVLHDLSLSYGGPLRRVARWSFGNADQFARSAARNKALILSVTNPLWEEEQASRWLPVQTFPVAYPFRVVFGDPSPGITFASSKEIVRILPGGKEARRFPVLNPLPIEAIGDEFSRNLTEACSCWISMRSSLSRIITISKTSAGSGRRTGHPIPAVMKPCCSVIRLMAVWSGFSAMVIISS
jgi:hypothetical protein